MKEAELMTVTLNVMDRVFKKEFDRSFETVKRSQKDHIMNHLKEVQIDIIDAVLGDFSREQVVDIIKIEFKLLSDALSICL